MSITCALEAVPDRDIAVLKVQGELDWEDRTDFHAEIERLLRSDRPRLVIDLSRVTRMGSVYLGTLIDVGARAKEGGKGLSVILVDRMATVARRAGLEKVVSLIGV